MMFGSSYTLRDWSSEGTRGNKAPTHISVFHEESTFELSKLDPAGMILIAMLSGGDYSDGLPGFGIHMACDIARAGFGTELLDLLKADDHDGIQDWRDRLQIELEENTSGYFKKKHKTIRIPPHFPDVKVLKHYTDPGSKLHGRSTEAETQIR